MRVEQAKYCFSALHKNRSLSLEQTYWLMESKWLTDFLVITPAYTSIFCNEFQSLNAA